MLVAILLAGMSAQGVDQTFFDNLLHWREQFETVLKEPAESIGYTHVQSEMLGGAHGDALYPIGSAFERYILSFNEGLSGGMLLYEKRQGSHTSVIWHVPFRPVKKKGTPSGTVRKFLLGLGFGISPKTRLTPAIRRQLSRTGHFAYYSFHPEMGGYASVVRPNGTSTKTHRTSGPFSITPEEQALLRKLSASKRSARP